MLPAANAYEKAGTFTNTCGDLQLVKKAGEFTGIKSDFEIIVRIAERMGIDVRKLVPSAAAVRADMGQIARSAVGRSRPPRGVARGAQSRAEAQPVRSHGDSGRIQRLVPGYDVSRLNLLAGNDQHTIAAEQAAPGAAHGSGTDCSGERHAVHVRHAGTVFAAR